MADTFNFVQVQDLFLAGSGVTSSATTIILRSFKLLDDTNVAMTDFGTIGYGTLEPNTEKEENISFTGITQNGDGTATLTGVTRGLKFVAPYTEDATLKQSHGGGTLLVISNSAPFYNQMSAKGNDETISGKYTFPVGGNASAPVSGTSYSAPTDDLEYAAKKYVDDVAVAGAPDATTTVKGNVEIATDAELSSGAAAGSGDTSADLVAHAASFNETAAAGKVPVADSSGKIGADWGGAASTLATLDGSSKVVQDPANATATPTASKIPIADGSGKLDSGWLTQKFGGDGSDGALNVTSGTTTIDLANAAVVELNYTTFNVSAGATLTFENPNTNGTHIFMYVQGNATIAGTIDATGMGAAGGAANSTSGLHDGYPGKDGYSMFTFTHLGAQGTSGAVGSGGADADFDYHIVSFPLNKYPSIFVGAGGGSGNANNAACPKAGTGGAGIIMEIGGAMDFSGSVISNGEDGGNSTGVGTAGASGAGGGGFVGLFYNTLTTNTGTITVDGGTGGLSTCSGSNPSYGGGGGGSADNAGSSGVARPGDSGLKSGGDGGDGEYLIAQNTMYN